MKVASSYAVEIKNLNRIFKDTVNIYRKALSFLIDVYDREWDYLSSIPQKQKRFNVAEHLIHSTNNNKANSLQRGSNSGVTGFAKYDFDTLFYKMPAYLRRDLINTALGAVSSYRSNQKNWEAAGKVGNKPTLQAHRYEMPVFFRDNMYQEESDTVCKLKLFHQNDWIWVPVNLLKTDVDYLKKYWSHIKPSTPKLEKRHKKYYLRFTYEEDTKLSAVPVEDQIICSVDLGINSDAVCSIMVSNGTDLARKFINFSGEKDHLYHALNRIRKFQREHGSQNSRSFWEYVNSILSSSNSSETGFAKRLNIELSIKIAAAVTSFSAEYHTDVIVFEYLDFKGAKHGSKK